MKTFKFNKELYPKVALIKAAYNYTDKAYVHLDSDDQYYYVTIDLKSQNADINEKEFENEMMVQNVRHEVYMQTKNIRELILARAVATSVITSNEIEDIELDENEKQFSEDEILKDWFSEDE